MSIKAEAHRRRFARHDRLAREYRRRQVNGAGRAREWVYFEILLRQGATI